MTGKRKEGTEINNHSTNEIPMLFLEMSEHIADLKVKEIKISSQGWNIQECMQGMDYLLEKVERLKRDKDEGSNICKSEY